MSIYTTDQICIVIPTKDRPNKVKNLLNSIKNQTIKIKHIKIIASGMDINSLIKEFDNDLFIDYIYSNQSGQIYQRNLGLKRVSENINLIMTLDDDVIFEIDAFENILSFINNLEDKFVGIAFNLTNIKKHKYSYLKEKIWLSHKYAGRVLQSGYVTSIGSLDYSIKSEWLIGGASLWIKDVLLERIKYQYKNDIWSPCEDVMFSYQFNNSCDMWVCSTAKAIHDDEIKFSNFKIAFKKGFILSEWVYYFVKNYNLSTFKFIVATVISSIISSLMSIFSKKLFFNIGRFVFVFSLIIKLLTNILRFSK